MVFFFSPSCFGLLGAIGHPHWKIIQEIGMSILFLSCTLFKLKNINSKVYYAKKKKRYIMQTTYPCKLKEENSGQLRK